MCFAYIHCWATDVFSMAPPRDYVSGTEQNQITRRASLRQSFIMSNCDYE
jgi:hypothetical protein